MQHVQQGQRNARIDLLRGVSILLVLFHHFNIAYRLNDTSLAALFGWDAVHAVARNGNYGVTMFFVISGFLITSNAERRWSSIEHVNCRAFYAMRFARIAPCLLLLLALVNLFAAMGVAIFQNRAPAGVAVSFWSVNLASLTFWMNVLIGKFGWVNYALGVLWSLSVEEVFYLSFPVLCVVLRRESRLFVLLAVMVALGPWYRFTHQDDEGGFLYAYFACFDGIAIGCATALIAKRVALGGRVAAWLQVLVVGAMAWLYLYRPIGETHVFGVTAMALGTAVLLLAANQWQGAPVGRRWAKGIEWFGCLSYELYLFHLVVLGWLRTAWPPQGAAGDGKLLLLAGFLALSAVLSATVAWCYAEPLNRWLRRRLYAAPAIPRTAAERSLQ
ncbi:acyltransferase family protein [Paraburkholderia pallida]|uniref:Acyltransferase n=1 Tax=Paraburkholderia pallida TaxID=2547399 RepID=A0A4P7D3A0_9BURK|nr:acyltransferase [Paraburkholderia pallida]QBR00994.1 acyltransferase [Paraburkholderia pallida]